MQKVIRSKIAIIRVPRRPVVNERKQMKHLRWIFAQFATVNMHGPKNCLLVRRRILRTLDILKPVPFSCKKRTSSSSVSGQ